MNSTELTRIGLCFLVANMASAGATPPMEFSEIGAMPLAQPRAGTMTEAIRLLGALADRNVISTTSHLGTGDSWLAGEIEAMQLLDAYVYAPTNHKDGALTLSEIPGRAWPTTVFPPDDRQPISPTTSYPWSAVTMVYVARSGRTSWCSGVMVGPSHVLTAGHCVYFHTPFGEGWADSVLVVPAADGFSMPFGEAQAVRLRASSSWIMNGSFGGHDWGLITLDRNTGRFTGWMNMTSADPGDPLYVGLLHTAGYPAGLSDGVRMYHTSDNGCWADNYTHGFWLDVTGGQSGSPIWVENGTDYSVLSVVSRESVDQADCNVGARIDQKTLDALLGWISSDSIPADRADLVDLSRDIERVWGNFTPDLVVPEKTLIDVRSRVQNKGTLPSGGFYVSYFASAEFAPESTIDSKDFFIGESYIESLAPFEVRNLTWSGMIPSGVPDGSYWILWLFDSRQNVTEYVETDNVGAVAWKRLTIDGSPPETMVAISGLAGTDSWYGSVVSLDISANDNVSGVETIVYRIDGSAWQVFTAPVELRAEGHHAVEYYSTDRAGNTQQIRRLGIGIDLSPPTKVVIASPFEGQVVNSRDVEIRYEATDAISGIEHFVLQMDTQAPVNAGAALSYRFNNLPEGLHLVRVTAVDWAGNERFNAVTFRVDASHFSPTGPYGILPLTALIAATTVGGTLAFLVLARRRKRARTARFVPDSRNRGSGG